MVTQPHLDAIERARRTFEEDRRVLALWIEGSVGRGTADTGSDVDVHLAVADDAFDEFVVDPETLIGRVGRALGYLTVPLSGGWLFAAAVEGPARVDLYVERRSTIVDTSRQPGRSILFDRDGVVGDLDAAPDLTIDPTAFLEELMRSYWFGAMWPGRFIARRDWGALLMNATTVMYQFVVPAMLLADGSPEYYREGFNRPRFLSIERRAAVNALLAQTLTAFGGLEANAPDVAAIFRFHEELLASVWGAFREACAATGVAYSTGNEAEYRGYHERELGLVVSPFD